MDLIDTAVSMLMTVSTEKKAYIFIEVRLCQTDVIDFCSHFGSIQ